MDNAQHGRIVQAGLRFILAGGIHFIQKEAGWTVETVKIRTYQSALQRNVALRSRWCGQLAGSGSGVQMHPRRLGGAVPGLTFQSAKCLTAYGVQVIQTNLVENSQSSLSLATNLVVGQLFSTLDLTNQLKATFGGTKKKP